MKNSISGATLPYWVSRMQTLVERLREIYQSSIPFGQGLVDSSPDKAVESTILYRLTKYWSEPGDFAKLHNECSQTVLDLDFSLHDFQVGHDPDLEMYMNAVRKDLYWAQYHFRGFDPRKAKFASSEGETFVSSNGQTSLWDKAHDPRVWCCTNEAFCDAGLLFYSTRFLKLIAMRHYDQLENNRSRNRDLSSNTIDLLNAYVRYSHSKCEFPDGLPVAMVQRIKRKVNFGEAVFLYRLTHVVTFVLGGRFGSVEKDASKNRGIEPQPWLNVCIQLAFSNTVLRPMCLHHYGLNLDDQWMQKDRVRDVNQTTADFSAASELQSRYVLGKYVPDFLREHILAYTVDMIYFPSESKDEGRWHFLAKVSSMGCGLTFEYLSMMICAIARRFDPKATVYGDDLVISNNAWPIARSVYESLGYQVNEDKTFHESVFRESCGSFYHDDFGYILTYKLSRPDNLSEYFINLNKLQIVAMFVEDYRIQGRKPWLSLINEFLTEVSTAVPLRCRRDLSWFDRRNSTLRDYVSLPLDEGVLSFNHSRRYSRDRYKLKGNDYFLLEAVSNGLQKPFDSLSYVSIPYFVSNVSSANPDHYNGHVKTLGGTTTSGLGALYYVHSGRRISPVLNRRGRWKFRNVISDGSTLYPLRPFRAMAKEIEDRNTNYIFQLALLVMFTDGPNARRWHNLLTKFCVK